MVVSASVGVPNRVRKLVFCVLDWDFVNLIEHCSSRSAKSVRHSVDIETAKSDSNRILADWT